MYASCIMFQMVVISKHASAPVCSILLHSLFLLNHLTRPVYYMHHAWTLKEAATTSHPASQKCTRSDVISQTCFALKILTKRYAEQVYMLPISKAASAGSSNVWVYIRVRVLSLSIRKGKWRIRRPENVTRDLFSCSSNLHNKYWMIVELLPQRFYDNYKKKLFYRCARESNILQNLRLSVSKQNCWFVCMFPK